jgi:hypothetical protein
MARVASAQARHLHIHEDNVASAFPHLAQRLSPSAANSTMWPSPLNRSAVRD